MAVISTINVFRKKVAHTNFEKKHVFMLLVQETEIKYKL